MLVQHLLFAFLVAIAPAWDYYDTRGLKREPQAGRKIRYYRTLCAWLGLATLTACLSVDGSLFTIHASPDEAHWLLGHAWVRYLVEALIAAFAVLILLPYVLVLWKKVRGTPRSWKGAEALKSLSFFLPSTREERRWYAVLAITAGICEETLFRGFLLHYLHVIPWRIGLTQGLLLSSIIFGLQHLYQGRSGVVGSSVIGFVFGLLYLLSGSLLLPILIHAAMDLRILVMLPPPGARTESPA
jgi:membrane protease YdiL (CAAX protease family)